MAELAAHLGQGDPEQATAAKVLTGWAEKKVALHEQGKWKYDINHIYSPFQRMRDTFDVMPKEGAEAWSNIAVRLQTLAQPARWLPVEPLCRPRRGGRLPPDGRWRPSSSRYGRRRRLIRVSPNSLARRRSVVVIRSGSAPQWKRPGRPASTSATGWRPSTCLAPPPKTQSARSDT